MLSFLPILSLAQVLPPLPVPETVYPREVFQPQEIRSLPGQLDSVPVFNSNSPELVQNEGILLSTFPAVSSRSPVHLNFPFKGRFDVFAHHIAKGVTPEDVRSLYIGILVHNPGKEPVTLDILQAATYLSQEAPFYNLPSQLENPFGTIFAGPGSRTMDDVLRGKRQPGFSPVMVVPPGQSQMLLNLPIPLRSQNPAVNSISAPPASPIKQTSNRSSAKQKPKPRLQNNSVNAGQTPTSSGSSTPPRPAALPINGRSVLLRLWSNNPVHLASLAMSARLNPDGSERAPSLEEWQNLLKQGRLAGPRDIAPTSPDSKSFGRFFYGRVAGVAQGSEWRAQITDPKKQYLTIPQPGQEFSYALSTVDYATFGTGQIQSAPMLARYPDTAYRAHGNYGIHYNLTLPLRNRTSEPQKVAILLQTPLKDEQTRGGLRFLDPPDRQIFFRGTVRVRFNTNLGLSQTRFVHLVQRRGQQGEPLVELELPPGDRRLVEVDFLYPPDSTPPQVLTVRTLNQLGMP